MAESDLENRKKNCTCFVLMKSFLFIFLFLNSEKVVISEGVASLQNVSKGIARDRAIQDALRNAVEQGAGVFLSSETIVENYELLQDKIFSKAEGYVKEYRVISEKEENGLYRVKIKAVIKEGKLKDDLVALRLLILEKGRPRVLVISNVSFLEDMLTGLFRDTGFPVLDPLSLKKKMGKEKLRLVFAGANDTMLARYALREGAEIVVFAEYREEERMLKASYFNRKIKQVILTARTIDPRSAEIMASERIEKSYPEINSVVKKKLVDSLFNILKKEIVEGWQVGGNIVKIHLYNISFEKFGDIRNFLLENVRRVEKVIIREYVGNAGILEVITPESPENIAYLLGKNFNSLKIKEIQGMDIYVEKIKNKKGSNPERK